MSLTPLGWYHVVVFALIVPALALLSRRRLGAGTAPLPARVRQFRATSLMLVLFGGLSVLTAGSERLELFAWRLDRPVWSLAAAAVMFVGAVVVMRPRWRRAVIERRRIVHLFMPQTPAERTWWVVVSTLAGISEEITWRGVQAVLLAVLTGSILGGALLSALMFGAAHAVQCWRSTLVIVAFALAFQGLYWLSGTLHVGMIVHAAYDITAGWTYGRFGRELGYSIDPAPGEAVA